MFEYPQNLALQRLPVGKWLRQVHHEPYWPVLFHIISMQPQHLRMGHRDGMPRSVHKLRRTPCMPVRPGYMRRVGYPGIHGRHVNVLYTEGANLAGWVLVYAVFD